MMGGGGGTWCGSHPCCICPLPNKLVSVFACIYIKPNKNAWLWLWICVVWRFHWWCLRPCSYLFAWVLALVSVPFIQVRFWVPLLLWSWRICLLILPLLLKPSHFSEWPLPPILLHYVFVCDIGLKVSLKNKCPPPGFLLCMPTGKMHHCEYAISFNLRNI